MEGSNAFARNELGAFLRSRRERRDPTEFGFPDSDRRRTPGLRRGEVARLAGVSVTWYTWLEQGRKIGVSDQVLASIARALHLTTDESRHLFSLAGKQAPPSVPAEASGGPESRQLLELLNPCPSWVFNQYFDILSWNRAAAGLLRGLESIPAGERNALELLFFDPRARSLLPEWAGEARRLVALLRAEVAADAADPRFAAMVAALRERSAHFRHMWDSREVDSFRPSARSFRHPDVGLLRLPYLRLDLIGENRRSVMIHYLPSDHPDYPLLQRLMEIGVNFQDERVPDSGTVLSATRS